MPEHRTTTFDASTSSSDPYYLVDKIVEHDGNLWRVLSVRSQGGTQREATLEAIDYPTEDENTRAVSWRWSDGRMAWVPYQRG